eukprot:scaffold5893_cov106-Skeletonema_marinoi.AAC.1
MMKKAPTNIKRRRISAAESAHLKVSCLTDLPSGILAHAASFLAAPSRALFAVALDENSAVSPNERSSAIVGNQWDILDFGEIEEDLAVKLSDAHIEKVLLCIDAINNLRRLKMANCTIITGAGLEPLRGSTIIEQIDLSILNDPQNYYLLRPRPAISSDRVLPVLDSIIEREGCAQMHLQFPFVWRERASTASEFHAFIVTPAMIVSSTTVTTASQLAEKLKGCYLAVRHANEATAQIVRTCVDVVAVGTAPSVHKIAINVKNVKECFVRDAVIPVLKILSVLAVNVMTHAAMIVDSADFNWDKTIAQNA